MTTEPEEVKIPADVTAVVARFADRGVADRAVDALTKAGFGTDQISFVARGAETVDGKFVTGALMITVHPGARERDAMRVLRERGAADVRTGTVSATGDVLEESEAEETATR